MKSIYFAGPDIFRADMQDWRNNVIKLCQKYGVTPLLPCDCQETSPDVIRSNNLSMINSASAIIANLNPFRGTEVDTGTAFEIGYACALGKPAVGFVSDLEPMERRVERLCGPLTDSSNIFQKRDKDGFGVESFSLPTNLMIAAGIPIVAGSEINALQALLEGNSF